MPISILQMTDFWLNAKYEGVIYSSAWETVAANHYIEKLQQEGLLANPNANGMFAKEAFVMITDGDKTFFGGEGQLFEEFLNTRTLSGYVGESQPISKVTHQNYTTAQLAMVRFDQAFKGVPYDARRREFLFKVFYFPYIMVYV